MRRTDRTRCNRHRSKWLALLLMVFVPGGFAAAASEAHAASRGFSNPAKFAGAFVNWGPDGREHTLQAWEKWLKQPPTSVLGVDFYAQSTWDDLYKFSWVPGIWKKLNPARNVVWSVPLTVKGTPLADVANGLARRRIRSGGAHDRRSTAKGDHSPRLGNEPFDHGVVRQGSGGRLHQGVPARRRNIPATLRRFQLRLVSGMGRRRTAPRIWPIPATTSSIISASMSTISNMRAPSRNDGSSSM